MKSFNEVYRDKTVCVTGHTGFKGSWLSEWLLLLGANVVGYALDPPASLSLYEGLGLSERLTADVRGDVRSLEDLKKTIRTYRPDFLFHFAAQPLVRRAFKEAYYTFEVNALGSLNVLEAVRLESSDCVVVMITTDKVYENSEWLYAYREEDPLGGHDPYSASKACAEIMISSYRRSFFSKTQGGRPDIALAVARGGNVIGGGDWAEDRIVPDSMRHLVQGKPIPVRNRTATRPWQHVLELLSGYLHLGAEIFTHRDTERIQELCSAFNFGPHITSNKSVEELVVEILKHWEGEWTDLSNPNAAHEAGRLNLTIDKAYHMLGWEPQWNFEETIKHTVDWYRRFYEAEARTPEFVRALTDGQILSYGEKVPEGMGDWQTRLSCTLGHLFVPLMLFPMETLV